MGAIVRATFGDPSHARGNPANVAQAILRLTEEKEPPVHLLVGSDAVRLASESAAARAAEDARWKALSLSTDYDDRG